MTVKGIDVSDYQGSSFSTSGLGFVIVKATEGRTYINPKQAAQPRRARDAGCVVGFYHFLWPGNIQEQAEYFVAKCASAKGDLLAVDWENTSSGTRASGAEKDAFIRAVKALRSDHRMLLYCNRDFWLNHDTTSYAGDGLWIADYNGHPGRPGVRADWLIHQYTSDPVDTNTAEFVSATAMHTWARGLLKDTEPPAKDKPTAPARPTVDLSKLVVAAKADPRGRQGHQTYAAGVRLVETALVAEGVLGKTYSSDGSFGSVTVAAYAAWQRRLGYSGHDADGIPGKTSLTKLGAKHGFTVVA